MRPFELLSQVRQALAGAPAPRWGWWSLPPRRVGIWLRSRLRRGARRSRARSAGIDAAHRSRVDSVADLAGGIVATSGGHPRARRNPAVPRPELLQNPEDEIAMDVTLGPSLDVVPDARAATDLTDLLPDSPSPPARLAVGAGRPAPRAGDRRRRWDDDWVIAACRFRAALGRAWGTPTIPGWPGTTRVLGAHRLRRATRHRGGRSRPGSWPASPTARSPAGSASGPTPSRPTRRCSSRSGAGSGAPTGSTSSPSAPGLHRSTGRFDLEAARKAWAYHGGPGWSTPWSLGPPGRPTPAWPGCSSWPSRWRRSP